MYTGAIENHPAIIEAISQSRALLGNSAAVVRRVRDPWNVAAVVRQAGLQFPEMRVVGTEVPPPGYWVLKPFRSGGGRKMRLLSVSADAGARSSSIGNASVFYLQRQVLGQAYGAVYLGDGQRALLLGITQQLVGSRWAGAHRFWYSGSIGPVALKPDQMRQFTRLGQCLTSEFSLRGLFGVDAIVAKTGVWALEVNPRYTASVEVLERCLEIPVIRWHAVACSEGRLPPEPPAHTGTFWGKAVLYARRPLVVTGRFCEFVRGVNQRVALPEVADVPAEGARIRPGQPIVSIFANGRSMAESHLRLRRQAAAIHRLLGD